jgi:hypothetical protein
MLSVLLRLNVLSVSVSNYANYSLKIFFNRIIAAYISIQLLIFVCEASKSYTADGGIELKILLSVAIKHSIQLRCSKPICTNLCIKFPAVCFSSTFNAFFTIIMAVKSFGYQMLTFIARAQRLRQQETIADVSKLSQVAFLAYQHAPFSSNQSVLN